jgi:outer membrane protein TolC
VAVALVDSALAGSDSLLAMARANSPRLQQARAQVDLATAAGSVARSARWPALGVFARGNAWSDEDGHQSMEWSAGAQVDFAVWTGGARRAHIAAADASARAAQAATRLSDLDVERDIDRARGELLEARARVASLAVAVSRFHEVVRIRQLALTAGTGTQRDYLDAQADLLDAQAALIEARHRDILACSALALHTGQLDLDWLRQNLENRP